MFLFKKLSNTLFRIGKTTDLIFTLVGIVHSSQHAKKEHCKNMAPVLDSNLKNVYKHLEVKLTLEYMLWVVTRKTCQTQLQIVELNKKRITT